ncbi:hypothetical protein UFOVP526_4 [uncultured Caudovirales phage]|uniref:Uncharacterized protein n=1 Tax=uncultured Caudovirales phage TaxID=2100421 RepID=A0A6J5MNW3_9CAUD|nr:hypothetical protein UFOVP526_4 [uncultured Caudovirales phage]
MSEAIIVACIASVGGVLAALIQSLRRENANDHDAVQRGLTRIESKVDTHINDHARGDM